MNKKWKKILNSPTLITLGVVLSLLVMLLFGMLNFNGAYLIKQNFYGADQRLDYSLIRFNVSLVASLYLVSLTVWTFRNEERDIVPVVVALLTTVLAYIFIGILLNVSIVFVRFFGDLLGPDIIIFSIMLISLAISIQLSCLFQKPKPSALKKRIRRIRLKAVIGLSIFLITQFFFFSREVIPPELKATKITFVKHGTIYSINANGSRLTKLTRGGSPAWSADGEQIAFVFWPNKNTQIYRINTDGSGQVPLTQDSSNNREPTWSPDSQKIAFVSNRDGNSEIYVMNADGSNPRRLTNNPAEDIQPDWSPDGKSIAFVSDRDGHEEIYTMSVDGEKLRRLTYGQQGENSQERAFFPDWSPDGQRIAFSTGNDKEDEIYIINADGSERKEIAEGTHPTWSPNGRAIAFIGVEYDPPFWDPGPSFFNGLWIVDLDNLHYFTLTHKFDSTFFNRYRFDSIFFKTPILDYPSIFDNLSWGPFPSKQ